MSTSLLFWILMLIWLVCGLWSSWPINSGTVKASGGSLLLFVLLLILGWRVFGAPLHG